MKRSTTTLLLTLGLVLLANAAERVLLSKSLSHENFSAYIGQSFYVYGGEKGLRKVYDGTGSLRTEQFSLVFAGPCDVKLLEGIYTITHPVAGKTKMLLQPKGRDAYNRYYTGVFNLLL